MSDLLQELKNLNYELSFMRVHIDCVKYDVRLIDRLLHIALKLETLLANDYVEQDRRRL